MRDTRSGMADRVGDAGRRALGDAEEGHRGFRPGRFDHALEVLIAIQFEERDLIHEHGADYEAYRRRVPMLIPFTRRNAGREDTAALADSLPSR